MAAETEVIDAAGRDDIVTEVLERLDEVGRLVADGAEAGFEILVRQAMVEGIANFVWAIFWLIPAFLLAKQAKKLFTGDYANDIPHRADEIGFGILVSIAAGIPALVAMNQLSWGIKRMINPAFYAIKYVLDAVGG